MEFTQKEIIMIIGIITFHRAHNYGAVLQCYALQEILRNMGYDVEVIDYRQPAIEHLYNKSQIEQIMKNIFHPRALIGLKTAIKQQRIKRERYEGFCSKFLNTTEPCTANNIPECDVYIVGSDQMWSIDCVGGVVDPVYFGSFKRKADSKLVGFSISSNMLSLDRLNKRISEYIKNFNCISFREQKIADVISGIANIKFPVTLDPTLCAGPKLWDKVIKSEWKDKKYIAVYHVKLRFASIVHKLIMQQAQRLAGLYNWDIIDLSTGEYSVENFVSVIKYAQCVLTSSFHATVFSVIFSRPLFSVKLHDGNDERYVNILNSIGMDKALVDLDFTEEIPIKIDCNRVNEALIELRETSIDYLKSALS